MININNHKIEEGNLKQETQQAFKEAESTDLEIFDSLDEFWEELNEE